MGLSFYSENAHTKLFYGEAIIDDTKREGTGSHAGDRGNPMELKLIQQFSHQYDLLSRFQAKATLPIHLWMLSDI